MRLHLLHLLLQLLHAGVGLPLLLLHAVQPPLQLVPLLRHLTQVELALRPSVHGLRGRDEDGAGVLQAQLGVLPQRALLLQQLLQLAQLLGVVSLLLLALVLLRDDAGAALRQLLLQVVQLRLLPRGRRCQTLLQLLHLLLQLPLVGLEAGLHAGLLLRDGGQRRRQRAQLAPEMRQAALRLQRGRGLLLLRLSAAAVGIWL